MSEVRKVVLIPRFSTYAGTHAFRSAPVNVRDVANVRLVAWRSDMGEDEEVSFFLEESVDLLVWNQVDGSDLTPDANEEETALCELELPWIRSVTDVSAPNDGGAVVTCWLVGDFTMRDR